MKFQTVSGMNGQTTALEEAHGFMATLFDRLWQAPRQADARENFPGTTAAIFVTRPVMPISGILNAAP